jgi:dihydroxyacetone kinase-like predicted kinase
MGTFDGGNGAGDRVVKGTDAAAIAAAMVAQSGAGDASLITLYYGSARKLKDADNVAEALRQAYPNTAVEVYYGGQPSSDYVISIER